MRLRLLLSLLFLLAMPATAAYKWTMPDGSVIFSDQRPHPDAEQITLLPTQTFTPPPLSSMQANKQPTAAEQPPPLYTSLTITRPADEQTIRENSGDISVLIALEPALLTQKGHKIIIKLDGETIITTTSTQSLLPNVDRGSHTLTATIIDKEGAALISSDERIFYLHRVSILH